ncbi:MAG: tetratricopeptide repeat protein [Candidatus Peribacteraceae bacterium]|nr:tetratricopeptide repeat protein [Candidatus Peribacteraceae bacterium]
MRKQLLGLAIALAVLIVAISVWVVVNSFQTEEADLVENTQTAPSENEVETPSVVRSKTYEEHMRSGAEALALENFEQAESEFAAAASSEPSAIEPLLNLTEAQVQLKEFDKARSNLLAAEQLDATNSDIFILRGIIFLREDNFLEAEQAFSKGGTSADFWSGLMAAFFDRRAEAEKLLTETTDARAPEIISAYTEYDRFPDSPKTHLDTLLSRAFVAIGEYELALAKIGPVLEDDANYRDAWILTGYAQYAKQNFELARESWQTAYALDPGKPETQYFLGLVNLELKNLDEAEKFLLLARENRSAATDLEEKLVELYLSSGKYRAAADLLAEEIESNTQATMEEFTRAISLYLEKLNDGRSAWDLANLATKRFPESGEAYNLAGWVSLTNGYLAEARTQLDQSIRLDPKSPWPYYNLGRVFEKDGKTSSALAAYHEAFDLDSEGPAGLLAGQNYNRLLAETKPAQNE